MLAETLPTNQLDPSWLFEAIKVIFFVGGFAMLWSNSRRKPSVDVEMANLNQRLAAVEKTIETDLEDIKEQLSRGADLHRNLQSQQAVNSERLLDVQTSIHDLRSRLNAMTEQILKAMHSKPTK